MCAYGGRLPLAISREAIRQLDTWETARPWPPPSPYERGVRAGVWLTKAHEDRNHWRTKWRVMPPKTTFRGIRAISICFLGKEAF
jgi:hypothetical protein